MRLVPAPVCASIACAMRRNAPIHSVSSVMQRGRTAGLPTRRCTDRFEAINQSNQGEDGMKDHYAVLGVEADASASALKNAYRRKASEYHPDKNPSPDAAEKFRETQEAYDLLSDTAKRQDYDENRRRSLLENPLETARDLWKTYLNKVLQ